ncbi:MAG: TVP38/TMEM64 family protein [Alphaproteobacteria bacterium]|nr:TVP38/TMEM64 family protein [Alphaproteobacteria bacterium]
MIARISENWRSLIAITTLVLILVVAFANGLTPQGLFEILRENREAWQGWISEHTWIAAIGYTVFYVVAVTISLPGALWFTIAAGYLFGAWIALPISLIGVTLGATNIFLIARYLAGERFHERFDGRVARFSAGFRRDDFTYMILLRVTPVPFFLVNVAAALLGARLKSYIAGTAIGTIAPTILYVNFGAGIGELVSAGVSPGLEDFLRPQFLVVLVMALMFAFVPLLHRMWRSRAAVPPDKSS